MARPLRIEFPGAHYLVTSRGEGWDPVFLDKKDRLKWLEILEGVCERFGWVVYAWVQLEDQYLLVVQTRKGNLSSGMRQLNGVYTQWFNRKFDKDGPVFQGRFKSVLFEKEDYLKDLARFVVRMPVSEGLVKDPGKWAWSSFRATVGRETSPDWLGDDELLTQFGKRKSNAAEKFGEFVRDAGKDVPIWEEVKYQSFLGSDDFVDLHLNNKTKSRKGAGSRSIKKYLIKGEDEKINMAKAYLEGEFTLDQIAEYFGVHFTTVSRAVKAYEGR